MLTGISKIMGQRAQEQIAHAQRAQQQYNSWRLERERIAAMPRYDGETNIPVVKRK